MNPTQELVKEHSAISSMLGVLQTACDRMERGEDVPLADLARIVEFLGGFADGCHHRKEELCLFPGMERAGVPREGGPIAVMLSEHELGRKHIREMKDALAALTTDNAEAGRTFVGHARAYTYLLHSHIQKENNVLFPMAETRMTAEAKKELAEAFQRVEIEDVGAGRHEHFHVLLDDLRRKYPSS
jgi:hemerythrin-like domain-containing protein